MPKATLNIPAFAGGEISKLNPRDIPNEALSKAQDIMMDRAGLIRLMGNSEAVLKDTTGGEGELDANLTPGYGLYAFRADKHIKLEGKFSATATYTFDGTAYTKVTCEEAHKFATGTAGAGARIYLRSHLGTDPEKTALYKRHEILWVIDETNFVIKLLWSDLGASLSGDWVWNNGWGDRPYLHTNGQYTNEDNVFLDSLDWTWCTEDNNPSDSDPIDGEYIYIAIQDLNAINIYSYNHDVLIVNVATLTNENADGKNQSNVKPDMLYVDNALRISDGHISGNGYNNKPKLFGYFPSNKYFREIDMTDQTGEPKTKPMQKRIGSWNVYNGTKGDIPGTFDDTTEFYKGYLESSLAKPKDLKVNGNAATTSDYTGLQFQVSQYKTRDEDEAANYGGLSTMLNGTGDPGDVGTDFEVLVDTNATATVNIQTTAQSHIIVPEYGRQVHMVVSPDTRLSGDWQGIAEHSQLKFGMAWVYGTKTSYQESKIFRNDLITIKEDNSVDNTSGSYRAFTDSMSFRFEFFVKPSDQWFTAKYNPDTKDWGDPRLIGASIYITADSDGSIDDPLYLGTLYTDSEEGFIDSYGNKFDWKNSWTNGSGFNNSAYVGTNGGWADFWDGDGRLASDHVGNSTSAHAADDSRAIGCALRRVPTLTYKLRNYGLDPYEEEFGQAARWKTSVFAQNRLFVGGVQYLDGKESGRRYPDRMLMSPEVKYDIFPHNSYIDVQTNDGDSIVKLEYYKGKLLQFKRNVLYIIDISGEFYFNEATHMYIGIKNPWSSAVTPGGVAWVNNSGVFIYDGKQIINLIEKKISNSSWNEFCQGQDSSWSPMISFIPTEKQLLIARSPDQSSTVGESGDIYIYDVETESFTFGKQRIDSSIKSNFASSFNDRSLIGMSAAYSENIVVANTTTPVHPTSQTGSFLFTGGGTGSTAVTFQYYKGGNSEGTGGTWTNFTTPIKISNRWNIDSDSAQNLANYILSVAQSTTSESGWMGDLKVTVPTFGAGVMHIEVEPVVFGSAYITGAGDQVGTGYNSFRLFTDDATSNEWSTTTNHDGTQPDIGTTNGVSEWVTISHIGSAGGTAQVNTVTVDRGGSTAAGIAYNITLQIYGYLSDNQILHQFNMVYLTKTTDNSDQNLASSLVNVLRGVQDLFEESSDEEEGVEALSYVAISDASSGSFTVESNDQAYKFNLQMSTPNAITLKQFTSTSSKTNNVLIKTKEYDFNEPNVRKKIYKIYLTYKANDSSANSGSLSNIRVYYAMNGSDTFHPMKTKGSSDAAGTATNIPSSAEFTQAELIPNPTSSSNKPNKVYSVRFKICSEPTSNALGQKVDGFELNDLSIIHRVKSIK